MNNGNFSNIRYGAHIPKQLAAAKYLTNGTLGTLNNAFYNTNRFISDF
jgi:hypothetical protein